MQLALSLSAAVTTLCAVERLFGWQANNGMESSAAVSKVNSAQIECASSSVSSKGYRRSHKSNREQKIVKSEKEHASYYDDRNKRRQKWNKVLKESEAAMEKMEANLLHRSLAAGVDAPTLQSFNHSHVSTTADLSSEQRVKTSKQKVSVSRVTEKAVESQRDVNASTSSVSGLEWKSVGTSTKPQENSSSSSISRALKKANVYSVENITNAKEFAQSIELLSDRILAVEDALELSAALSSHVRSKRAKCKWCRLPIPESSWSGMFAKHNLMSVSLQ